jgi:hypothetical protein
MANVKTLRILAATAALATLAACATTETTPTPPKAQITSAGSWAFTFDAGSGLARTVLSGADGSKLVEVACKSPNGAVDVTDWTWSKASAKDAVPVEFAIGSGKAAPVGRIAPAADGRNALLFSTPSNDRVFRALTPTAPVSTSTPTRTHVWAAGSATRINDVVNSCRAQGS